MTKFLIDKEGFVVVKLLTTPKKVENEEIEDLEDSISHLNLGDIEKLDNDVRKKISGPKLGFTIPQKYIGMANDGTLTKDVLLGMKPTDLCRLATHPKAAPIILKELDMRGLPLKEPFQLFPHQIKVVTWMKDREKFDPSKIHGLRGGIIRLEMGLGKTLTAITHIMTSKKGDFPTLVIASKTVMYEWASQCEKFFGSNIKVLYLHKDFLKKDIIRITRDVVKTYDIVITTYDVCASACRMGSHDSDCLQMGDEHTLMKGKIEAVNRKTKRQSDRPKLRGIEIIYGTPWTRVIADESQRFANPQTTVYRCMMAIYGDYAWCLTGTPIRNYETDIWAQFRFCGYEGVSRAIEWKRGGDNYTEEHRLREAIFSMNYEDANIILPPKTKLAEFIFLEGQQKEVYDHILGATKKVYDDMINKLTSFACVLAMFTRLRQCAIAPYLLTAESKREKLTGKDAKADKEALELIKKLGGEKKLGAWCHDKMGEAGIHSAKMKHIVSILAKIPKNEKVLVFSMFTSCLDLLATAVETDLPDFKFVQIDGDTVGLERARTLDQFRNKERIRGLFLTYKVGSEGINLTESTHCVFIEPWWTDAVHSQAEKRIHRYGQTRPVFIHNVYIQDSIEEKIVEICTQKTQMAQAYLEGTERPLGKSVGLDMATLGKILGIHRY